jgi:CBS domain-containing protein
MRVDELMTRDVVTVTTDTLLKEVAELLVRHRISGLPVCDGEGEVVGVVSEKDILYKELGREERGGVPLAWFAGWRASAAVRANARTAADTMTSPALTIAWGRPVAAAARIMIERDVKRLPVLGDDGALVGIVSRADLVRAFARPDAEIRAEIEQDVLARSLWIPPGTVSVEVERGEVELAGRVGSRTVGEFLPRLVERVPGVVSVRSDLTWPDDGVGRRQRARFATAP